MCVCVCVCGGGGGGGGGGGFFASGVCSSSDPDSQQMQVVLGHDSAFFPAHKSKHLLDNH